MAKDGDESFTIPSLQLGVDSCSRSASRKLCASKGAFEARARAVDVSHRTHDIGDIARTRVAHCRRARARRLEVKKNK
jgi:hypothetical protein